MLNEQIRIIGVRGGISKEKQKPYSILEYTQNFEDTQYSKGDTVFTQIYNTDKPFKDFDSKYKYVVLEGYFELKKVFNTNKNQTEKVLKAVYDSKGNCILSCD